MREKLGRRYGLCVMAAALAPVLAIVSPAPRAGAHDSGRIELFITEVQLSPVDGGVQVSARLVDRDSGTAAPGFRIVASGTSQSGESVDPVVLEEVDGEPSLYRGALPLGVGQWTLTLGSQQGDSSLPAISSAKRVDLEIDAAGRLVTGAGQGGAGIPIGVVAAVALVGVGGIAFALARRRRPEPVTRPSEAGPLGAGTAEPVRSK